MGDQDHIGENLRAYLQALSPAVRDIFECFDFHIQIDRLAKAGLLYQVTEKVVTIDLHRGDDRDIVEVAEPRPASLTLHHAVLTLDPWSERRFN